MRFIRERLQCDGKVLYFAYHAGWFAPGGFGDSIRQLTGMNVSVDLAGGGERRFLHARHRPARRRRRGTGPRLRRPAVFRERPNRDAPGDPHGHGERRTRREAARRLDKRVFGVAGRIHSAVPARSGAEAGLTPVGPEDDVTYAGDGFLTIHALSDGEKTLRWDGPADVTDLTTGRVLARGVDHLTIPMKARETRWFTGPNLTR